METRLEALGKRAPADIRFMAPLGFADYVKLQSRAACVLSDSGTLTEEASLLGFPGVMHGSHILTSANLHRKFIGCDGGKLFAYDGTRLP